MRAMALCLSHRSGQQTQPEAIFSDQNQAITWYKKIIKLEPKNPDAWYGIACVYSRRKDLARTVKHFKKAHALWGGQKKYLMYLGHFYRQHGNLKKAQKYYKIAAPHISDHYGPNFALATLLEESGALTSAKKYAKKSIELFKKMPPRYHRSIRVRADIKRLTSIINKKEDTPQLRRPSSAK